MSSWSSIVTFTHALCVCLTRTEAHKTSWQDEKLDLFAVVFWLLLVFLFHASFFTPLRFVFSLF